MTYLPLILGMAMVTYIPRLIPLVLLKNIGSNKRFLSFLTFIPYTSLSILIIRGILTSDDSMRLPTIIGIITAGIIAYVQDRLILSVLAGILAAFISINVLNL